MPRPRIAPCALAALLLLGATACGGDDDETAPTTSTTAATSTPASTPTTGPGSVPTSTTVPGASPTTSPNLVPNDSPLGEQLLAPTAVGEGYGPDDTLGDGTFDGDLCEGVVIDPTWDDEAGQALSNAGADGALETFTQSILAFPDDAAASSFLTEVADGQGTCLGAIAEPVDAGDEAVLVVVSDEEGSSAAGLARVGARVTLLTAIGPADPPPVDEALVVAAATALGG